jgi:hypothetical protein
MVQGSLGPSGFVSAVCVPVCVPVSVGVSGVGVEAIYCSNGGAQSSRAQIEVLSSPGAVQSELSVEPHGRQSLKLSQWQGGNICVR